MAYQVQKGSCSDCGKPITLRSIRCVQCNTRRYQKEGSANWKGGNAKHPLYSTFNSMKTRCYNQNRKDYKHYGGRGIKIFEGWKDNFSAFATWVDVNLGSRPEKHTLDRVDVNKNYEPGNLRWATQSQQALNRVRKPQGRTPRTRSTRDTAPAAKLTWEQVREIRARGAAGEPRKLLAEEFETGLGNIYKILSHKKWKEAA